MNDLNDKSLAIVRLREYIDKIEEKLSELNRLKQDLEIAILVIESY